MNIVYISSPYSGDTLTNVIKARYFSKFAVKQGVLPIAPHLLFPQFLSEETEREVAMELNKALIAKVDELWVFGEKISKGMVEEINEAKKLNKPIKYFKEDCMNDT